MTYLGTTGRQELTVSVDRFNGTGACTQFTMSKSLTQAKDVEVLVNNVQQDPDNSYTVSGTTIVFTEAPSTGTNNIVLIHRTGTQVSKTQIDSADILNSAVTTSKLAALSVTGDKLGLTSVSSNNLTLTGVTAGTYGNSTTIPVLTVDNTGRVSSAANVSISSSGGQFLGTDTPFAIMYNGQFVNSNVTITGTYNAGSFGPITISNGVVVTVNTGAVWTIV